MAAARASARVARCALAAITALCAAGCASAERAVSPANFDASPLERYLVIAYGEADEYELRDRRLAATFQGLIAECMQKRGFAYRVLDDGSLGATGPAAPEAGTMEYRRLFGYGIASSPHGVDPTAKAQESDPNAELRDSLSDRGKAEYDLAFGGEETVGQDGARGRSGGCYDQAWDAVYGAAFSGGGQWQGLLAEMDSLRDRAADSLETALIDQDWASCMRERSFDRLDSPDAAIALAEERAQVNKGESAAFEIELAVADLECQLEVSYEERSNSISFEIEQRFVNEHKAELEAWADESRRRIAELTAMP